MIQSNILLLWIIILHSTTSSFIHYKSSLWRPKALYDTGTSNLIPEENPTADKYRKSLSNVTYKHVFDGLTKLYPPQELEKRNAVSRRDGYWKYINDGNQPPKQFTYGEFDFYFFAELIDRAHEHYFHDDPDPPKNWDGKVFADIGSGSGRLVFAAAALHPGLKLCRGIELLEGINSIALQNLELCRKESDIDDDISDDDEDDETEWRPFDNSFMSGSYFSKSLSDEEWLTQLQTSIVDSVDEDDEAQIEDNNNNNVDDDGIEWQPAEITEMGSSSGNMVKEFDWHSELTNEFSFDEESPDASRDIPDTDIIVDETLEESQGSPEYYLETVNASSLVLAPITFSCGSFENPYEYFGDVDICFVFSSCMSSDLMTSLSQAIGRQMKPGSIILTTEYMLPLEGFIDLIEDDEQMPSGRFSLELVEKVDGWCWLTGGQSTVYIHRVLQSLWDGMKREKPVQSIRSEARQIIEKMEKGELADTKKFVRDVYNAMAFHGYLQKSKQRPQIE